MKLTAFLTKSLLERQSHIDPSSDCLCHHCSNSARRRARRNLLNLLTLEDDVLNKVRDAHVCHLCSEPTCVNPFHLYFGPAKENVADRIRVNGHLAFATPEGVKKGGNTVNPLKRCLVCGMESRGNQIFNHVRSAHLGLKHRFQWKGVDVSHLVEIVSHQAVK